jgi:mono/diheme cytochrome c family protein
MKLSVRVSVVALCLMAVSAIALLAQKPAHSDSSSKAAAAKTKLVERGKYLVNEAGQCQDCHTARNETGEFVKQQWLSGSPLMFKPTVPVPNWVEQAPRIAGLPGFTDDEVIKFLTTGVTPNGTPARPPMPSYRFSREDATAITAYLRSLGTQSASTEGAAAQKKQ